MEKEIYTPMERNLIEGAKVLERMGDVFKLDLMLLELERSVRLMDGMPLPSLAKEDAANGE